MLEIMFSLLALMPAGLPEGAVRITAEMGKRSLKVGGQSSFSVSATFAPALSATDAGIPHPIVQFDLPEGVELTGPKPKDFRAFAKDEFLSKPYEMLLDSRRQAVRFKVTEELPEGATIGINLIAYVSDGDDTAFARRRVELPLVPGAVARRGEPSTSKWGDFPTLHIGDEAPDFSLPQHTGEKVTLSDFRGKKNVLVTTYRAHW